MPEVVEIVQRLGFEITGNENLRAQIDLLKQQAAAIEKLQKDRDTLNKFVDKDKSEDRAIRAKKAITDLTAQIDRQTAALTRQVQQNGKLQQAVNAELGIIQKLTDKISDLTHARERQTTTSGIAAINGELRQTQEELKKLTTLQSSAGGTGIIAHLFGIGNGSQVGRQVLQGALGGLGIGVGFSIIPAITSSLVELAKSEFDVVQQQDMLIKSNEELRSSFDSIADVVLKYRQAFIDIAENTNRANTVDEDKRKLDIVKAIGVQTGEVYKAEREELEATQKVRQDELTRLLAKKKVYDDINSLIENSARFSAEFSGRGDVQALGDPDKNTNVQFELFNNFANNLEKSDLPRDIVNKTIQVLRKAYDEGNKVTGFKGTPLTKVLTDELTKYGADAAKIAQEVSNKETEIKAAEIEFQSKKNEQLYQLNLKLQERINQAKSEALQESVAYQSQYEDNLTQLVKANTSRREDELRKLNIEKDQERKAIGIVDEEKYLQLKNGIIKEYAKKEDEIYDQNNTRRIEAEKRARDIILQVKASNLANTNGGNAAGGIFNLDTILEQQDISAQQQRVALQNQRKQAIDDARKYHVDILQVEQQFNDAEKTLIEKQNREKLDLQIKYYSDLLNFVKSESNRALLQFLADPTASGANAQKFLNGEQSGGDFRRRQARASFKDALAINKLNIADKQNELGQAQANQENIINNPEATVEDVKKIDEEVNRLTGDLQKLNENQATIITDEHIRQFNVGINLYNQLAQSAVQAYNTIAAARQEDLDREIAARTQRVDVALKLAERGNVEALNIEQEALRKAQQERRQDALQQQAINSALTVSNSALAVAKSAAEGGIFAPATIIATVSALIAGFATVSTLSRASRTTGFEKGGFTGDGNPREEAGVVHKGEYVMPASVTKKYRPLLEAIHKGEGIPMLRMPQHVSGNEQGVSKQQFERLEGAVYSVVDAINGKETNIKQSLDKRGFVQSVEEYQRNEKRKYRG